MTDAPGGGSGPRALAAGLDRRLAGGFVQDVRVGGPELLALAVRQAGHTEHVGISVLATAPGVMLLDDAPAQHPADGLLSGLRDVLRACLLGARVSRVAPGLRDSHFVLRIDAVRSDVQSSVILDFGGRGNLEVHRDGHAPHALRPPPGELPDVPAPAEREPPDDDGAATLARETHRVDALRRRLLHARRVTELRARLRRAGKAARALVVNREADVARLGEASLLRPQADALAAHLHLLTRGQARLDVDDWQGIPLRVALDPGLSPAENLRLAYGRAAKSERGAKEAGRRLDDALARAESLAGFESRAADPALESAEAAGAVDLLESQSRPLLRPERPQATPPRRGDAPGVQAPAAREYRSCEGHRILVGRSGRGNDELTFRIARGNDVWLHARGCAGAHVVLVLPKGAEIPRESLLDAATLAHVHSKLGREPRGEITWCRAKDVSKRRGMKPGEVTVTRERVIPLRVEPERVARLAAGGA